eukprot:TRINITY_DN11613_c0_g1_i2.p2 TRINITY_DN11613_c0_g1~~TRINITY_DN11613_c0_g1_i2.p2  ORF type:complete len:156 (+),score=57.29 TRINITY_DN11613_c0_g1_i2:84-551(+)
MQGGVHISCVFFFFFKQKTAYEMQRGLVGSEMCIRDRYIYIMSANEKVEDTMNSITIPAIKSLTITNKYPDKSLNEDKILVGSDGKYDYYSYLFWDISSIPSNVIAVSYTHLTLPTILLVQISVVAVSLKKKKTTKKLAQASCVSYKTKAVAIGV